MINSRTNQGSALLITLLLLSCIMLWSINVWRTTAFIVEMSLENQGYEAFYYATYGMYQWALITSKKNFEDYKDRNKKVTLPFYTNPYNHGNYSFEIMCEQLDAKSMAIKVIGSDSTNRCEINAEVTQDILTFADKKMKVYTIHKWNNT